MDPATAPEGEKPPADRMRDHHDQLAALTANRRKAVTLPVNRSVRFVIIGICVALVMSVALWPYIGENSRRVAVETLPAAPAGQSEGLSAARYTGTDRSGNPYTVSARHVESIEGDSSRMALEEPHSVVTVGGVETYELSAASGVYDRAADLVDLKTSVTLVHRSGYRFTSSSASIDLGTGGAAGSDPVDAEGKMGRLRAEGFRIIDSGNVVYFLGRSHMTIDQSPAAPTR